MSVLLASIAGVITGVWGIAHLLPTQNVVAGFGKLSRDNELVITQEWIAEGITLMFLGTLTGLVTALGSVTHPVVVAVYGLVAAMLLVLAALTALTGGRGSVVFFKICPLVKTVAAVLLLISIAL